ncbi:MAG: Panacea domain-containing protein [Pseudomonadota bacterium]|nr:Panacea domain-containing protein [Pseudomonadota bacterium]
MNKTTKSTGQPPELALDQASGVTTGTENPNLDVCPSCHYMRLRMELAYQSSASGRWKAHPSAMMPDGARVREAILHLIHRSDTMKFVVTQYDILKALFFADKSHLNRYRRPITFDQYHALPDGPVPSLSYDVLKEALHAFEAIEVDEALWQTEPADGRAIRYFGAQRDGSEEILSESDIEELDAAQDLVLKLGFRGVWNKTHDDPAYQKAWAQRGDAKRFPMQYEDLLERPDPKLIADLAFVSSHW